MIDTTGKCSACGQTVGIDTIHTCSPQVTAPTPERRVGEARVREIERMLSMLTAPASELVPLKVDGRTFADMKQVFADWLALTAEVERLTKEKAEVTSMAWELVRLVQSVPVPHDPIVVASIRSRLAVLAPSPAPLEGTNDD